MRLATVKKYLLSSHKPIHRNFTLIDSQKAEDLNLQITRLLHQKSGAMIYNIKSNDSDNTFAPIVRTLPQNNTGCPHILQHLACCGSERYPIRDPFFNMLRRSVNTYMNAWTGDDFTAYPFSSANAKDFNNLYKVYLDMCLKPLLNQLDFRQEGWRHEINAQNNSKQLKGIVFNEMKGAYQNPDRQLYIQMANKLFANTPYGYDSGGKPQSIVTLSYEQVQNMHKYYYHPSNMSFYYYGNADIKDKLEYLQQQYLLKYNYTNDISKYETKSKQLNSAMPQKLDKIFHKVVSQTAEVPSSSLAYNIGWIDQINGVDLTCLNILSYLLLQGNQAIFYQQFIESGLADSFGISGLNIGTIVSFSVTLKNSQINGQQMLKRVQKCFQQLIQSGVDSKRLDQYVIQTQLDILTPKKTQGINYLQHYTSYMLNRLPLTNLLKIRTNLNQAVRKLKNKTELKLLINKYVLSNTRKVVVQQLPTQTKTDEYTSLKGLQMSQNIITSQQKQLKQRQQSNATNSVQCLPKLSLSDLSTPKQYHYNLKNQGITKQGNAVKDIHVNIDKKNINFIRLSFKINMLQATNKQLLRYLDIWKYTLKQGIAVKGMTNKQVSSILSLCSHNFHISIQKPSPTDPHSLYIVFSASCLDKTLNQYIKILHKIIYQPQYKTDDIANIFRSYRSQKVQQLLDGSVMQYCLDYCSSFSNLQAQLFNSYYLVTQGIKIAESGTTPQEFIKIHNALIKDSEIVLIQHSNQYHHDILSKLGFKINNTKGQPITKQPLIKNRMLQFNKSVSVTNTYDVNFCTQQYPGPKMLSKQHAHIALFVQILQQDYLHPKIRQKGGAYGARATYRDSGIIAMYSYMDPYSTETYSAFDSSIIQILQSSISQQRLEEVKIKVIGQIDAVIPPQNQCVNQIYKGFTNQDKNSFIQYIKNTNWGEVIETGRKYLNEKLRNRVMFGKDVPSEFREQKLKIPKQQKNKESLKGDATHQVYDSS